MYILVIYLRSSTKTYFIKRKICVSSQPYQTSAISSLRSSYKRCSDLVVLTVSSVYDPLPSVDFWTCFLIHRYYQTHYCMSVHPLRLSKMNNSVSSLSLPRSVQEVPNWPRNRAVYYYTIYHPRFAVKHNFTYKPVPLIYFKVCISNFDMLYRISVPDTRFFCLFR